MTPAAARDCSPRFLARETNARILAGDVSAEAVKQARERNKNPDIDFLVLDLNRVHDQIGPEQSFDLIVLAQTIWCVLPNLEKILKTFYDRLEPNGGLLISQNFLQPGQQKYGTDIISTPEDLFNMLKKAGFEIKDCLETNRFTNHHLAVLAEKPASRPPRD